MTLNFTKKNEVIQRPIRINNSKNSQHAALEHVGIPVSLAARTLTIRQEVSISNLDSHLGVYRSQSDKPFYF